MRERVRERKRKKRKKERERENDELAMNQYCTERYERVCVCDRKSEKNRGER